MNINIIKGLLLKDLYVFKNYKGNIYFSFIMFIFLIIMASFEMDVFGAGSVVFLIFFGMNSISTFSYDENADSNRYLLSLPMTKKEIVFSKYLFTFLNAFLSLLIGIIVSFIITIMVRGNVKNLGDGLRLCFIAFTSSSFLMCADIPCIYKWGVEKGRMQSILVPVIIVFLFGIVISTILFIFPNLQTLLNLEMLFDISPILCLILNILLYLVSYIISYKIFNKKDC